MNATTFPSSAFEGSLSAAFNPEKDWSARASCVRQRPAPVLFPLDVPSHPSGEMEPTVAFALQMNTIAQSDLLGRVAMWFARRAGWSAANKRLFSVFEDDALRESKQNKQFVVPFRPLLAWNESRTAEPARVLKNDWKALWMGELTAELSTEAGPEVQDAFPDVALFENDVYAITRDTDGRVSGAVVLYEEHGIWRDRFWKSAGQDTDRALLAIVLRNARDGKHQLALSNAPTDLALERGAFWTWEWIFPNVPKNFSGRIAGALLRARAKRRQKLEKKTDIH